MRADADAMQADESQGEGTAGGESPAVVKDDGAPQFRSLGEDEEGDGHAPPANGDSVGHKDTNWERAWRSYELEASLPRAEATRPPHPRLVYYSHL